MVQLTKQLQTKNAAPIKAPHFFRDLGGKNYLFINRLISIENNNNLLHHHWF
jgi:hypothetical protein